MYNENEGWNQKGRKIANHIRTKTWRQTRNPEWCCSSRDQKYFRARFYYSIKASGKCRFVVLLHTFQFSVPLGRQRTIHLLTPQWECSIPVNWNNVVKFPLTLLFSPLNVTCAKSWSQNQMRSYTKRKSNFVNCFRLLVTTPTFDFWHGFQIDESK